MPTPSYRRTTLALAFALALSPWAAAQAAPQQTGAAGRTPSESGKPDEKKAVSLSQVIVTAVPEEIAVVGYDDVQLAAYFSPPLDTVRQSVQAGAAALMDALLARLAGVTPPSRLLPTELIARGSVRAEPSQSAH